MKIGILTFHCAHNYGAVLQAYALQETIKSFGFQVEIINYQPNYLLEPYKPISLKIIFSGKIRIIIKKIILSIVLYPFRLKRWKMFNIFIEKNFNLSKKCTSDIPSNYDLYIIGSDQIWNNRITRGFDMVYWGFFNTNYRTKKIAYAASFGDIKNIFDEKQFLEKGLENFDGISLRENDYLEYIKTLSKKNVFKVLDPTFLLNNSIWDIKSIKPEITKQYVLVYQVISSKETLRIASEIAKQINAVVIEIPSSISMSNFRNNIVSPFEFLGWIKYASCIVTTSFHGTAFSVIYKKNFYVINLENGSEKRSIDFLTSINLSNRIIDKYSSVNFDKIDYSKNTSLINKFKHDSFSFLNSFLKYQ